MTTDADKLRMKRAAKLLDIPEDQLDQQIVDTVFSSQRKAELYNRLADQSKRLKALKLLSTAAKSAGFDSPKKLLDFLKSYNG